jgi:hypothetical protein
MQSGVRAREQLILPGWPGLGKHLTWSDGWPLSREWMDKTQYDRIRIECRRCASTMTYGNDVIRAELRTHPRATAQVRRVVLCSAACDNATRRMPPLRRRGRRGQDTGGEKRDIAHLRLPGTALRAEAGLQARVPDRLPRPPPHPRTAAHALRNGAPATGRRPTGARSHVADRGITAIRHFAFARAMTKSTSGWQWKNPSQ